MQHDTADTVDFESDERRPAQVSKRKEDGERWLKHYALT
jgi:hypothetical protein